MDKRIAIGPLLEDFMRHQSAQRDRPGKYLLPVGRDDHAAARFQPVNRGGVKFSIGSGYR